MEEKTTYRKPVLLIIAFILLIIPLSIQGLWISVFNMESLATPADKSDYYLSRFPDLLQNSYTLVAIAFFCSLAAFILSALSLNKLKQGRKWLAYLGFAVSFLVGLLSLFQMM